MVGRTNQAGLEASAVQLMIFVTAIASRLLRKPHLFERPKLSSEPEGRRRHAVVLRSDVLVSRRTARTVNVSRIRLLDVT